MMLNKKKLGPRIHGSISFSFVRSSFSKVYLTIFGEESGDNSNINSNSNNSSSKSNRNNSSRGNSHNMNQQRQGGIEHSTSGLWSCSACACLGSGASAGACAGVGGAEGCLQSQQESVKNIEAKVHDIQGNHNQAPLH